MTDDGLDVEKHYCAVCDGFHKTPKPECLAFPFAPDSVGSKKLNPIDIEKLAASEQSVYAKEVWNAAIEAAALEYTKYTTENPRLVLDNLRKLKK